MNPQLSAKLNRQGNTVLPPSAMRVFVEICKAADARKPCTIRGIARSLGVRSHNSVSFVLPKLRDAGLIEWKIGEGATLRPLYRLTIFEESFLLSPNLVPTAVNNDLLPGPAQIVGDHAPQHKSDSFGERHIANQVAK